MADTLQANKFLQRAFFLKVLRRSIALLTLVCLIYGVIAVIYATKTIIRSR